MQNDFPRMVYKAGGPHEFNNGSFDYRIVADTVELDAALTDGWALTSGEALERTKTPSQGVTEAEHADNHAAPTRAELEQKARELHIDFRGNVSDKTLAARIDAALTAKPQE